MPLLEDEPRLSGKKAAAVGLPSFIIALVLSLAVHQYAHVTISHHACTHGEAQIAEAGLFDGSHAPCPIASLAGPVATFALALISFALYLRFPGSLFLGSLAFINATLRLPETVSVFLQLLVHQKTDMVVDESLALQLLHLHDPAVSVVLLCFLSLAIFFLAVIIVHDTRAVPSKWLVALGMFVVMIPLESFLWKFVVRMIS